MPLVASWTCKNKLFCFFSDIVGYERYMKAYLA